MGSIHSIMGMPSLQERSYSLPSKPSQTTNLNQPYTPSPSSSQMNSLKEEWLVSAFHPPTTHCFQLQESIADATSLEDLLPSNLANWLTLHMWSLQINATNQERSSFQLIIFPTQSKELPHPSQLVRNMMGFFSIYQTIISSHRDNYKYSVNLNLYWCNQLISTPEMKEKKQCIFSHLFPQPQLIQPL